jgi:hypothetical protein
MVSFTISLVVSYLTGRDFETTLEAEKAYIFGNLKLMKLFLKLQFLAYRKQ